MEIKKYVAKLQHDKGTNYVKYVTSGGIEQVSKTIQDIENCPVSAFEIREVQILKKSNKILFQKYFK